MRPLSEREVYTGDTAVLPELPLVGRALQSRARVPGLQAHVHSGIFEIFFIERGRVEWWVEDETCRVSANHIYINRPGEKHGSVGLGVRPCGYYWVQLAFPGNRLPGMAREESDAIRAALLGIDQRSFPASRELKQCFHALLEQHRAPAVHRALSARALLHLLLVRLFADFRAHAASRARDPKPSYAIRKAMGEIETNLAEIKSVRELARVSGLSVTQFSDRFFSEAGFTPAAYLRQRRIERARQLLLEGGGSFAETALATGFCSSQHFATVFKQVEGISPRDFVAKHRPRANGAKANGTDSRKQ